MFGKKKETIPEPSGMIVNPQNVEPGQIQGFQVVREKFERIGFERFQIDVDATVPTTGFFEFNSCGKATLGKFLCIVNSFFGPHFKASKKN